jgi:quercetin dioxygenase-like cupin family protein
MFTFHDDTNKIELGGGVSRRILSHGEDMMAVEVGFEAGAIGAMHTHPHVQISYVLEGKFEAEIGGEKRIISVGDTYYTLPDVPHGVVCLEKGKLLDIFTPERKDFLK